MNRRDILKSLAVIPALAIVAPAEAEPTEFQKAWKRSRELKEAGAILRVKRHIWYSESDFVIATTAEEAARLYRGECGFDAEKHQHEIAYVKAKLRCCDRLVEQGSATVRGVEQAKKRATNELWLLVDIGLTNGFKPEDWRMWPEDKPFPFTEEVQDEATTYFQNHLPFEGEAFHFSKGSTDIWAGSKDSPVVWHVSEGGRIWHKTTRKLPAEWVAEHPDGFFASTEC